MTTDTIPFNRPYATGKELTYQAEALGNSHLSGDGTFTKRCHRWIEQRTGCAAYGAERAIRSHCFGP